MKPQPGSTRSACTTRRFPVTPCDDSQGLADDRRLVSSQLLQNRVVGRTAKGGQALGLLTMRRVVVELLSCGSQSEIERPPPWTPYTDFAFAFWRKMQAVCMS